MYEKQPLNQVVVLIAGAGNIGSHLAYQVARAGVRLLRIVDRDTVEAKNLANQEYRPEDVGRPKAVVLAERIQGLFPGVAAEAHAADLEDVPLETFAVDVLLGGLDSRRARQVLVSEIGWPLGVPVVDGGVGDGLAGRVQTFVPGEGSACLECGWGKADYQKLTEEYSCIPGAPAVTPSTAALACTGAVVAGIMTAEAVRLVTEPRPADSHEIAFDLAHRRFLVSRLRRSPRCRFDHQIVTDRLNLGRPFAVVQVKELLEGIERRLGSSRFHLELRRGLVGNDLFGGGRFVPAEALRPRGDETLADLGLRPGDGVRARSANGSLFVWS